MNARIFNAVTLLLVASAAMPARFEMTKTNFSPDGDLAVLILKKMPNP